MAEVVNDSMTVTVNLTLEEVTEIRGALDTGGSESLYNFFDKLEDKMMGR
jgi:hypothetical protein